eukprot:COSAG04_NODE_315_length_17025_cov_118.870318_7_plen_138_part_00
MVQVLQVEGSTDAGTLVAFRRLVERNGPDPLTAEQFRELMGQAAAMAASMACTADDAEQQRIHLPKPRRDLTRPAHGRFSAQQLRRPAPVDASARYVPARNRGSGESGDDCDRANCFGRFGACTHEAREFFADGWHF